MRNCPIINADDNNLFMAPFEATEILESIKACAGYKAPGPDGTPWLYSVRVGKLLVMIW